ncbi:uncharacterized protein LOC125877994 [Solanum stenotomum]|uniref:uncharacterized protein LOC125877994 n=1 Tax=Solanum stenotomum TaxID=172797 RepID=UPI0020D1802C|nr:uncharacterized protein LOC125877994 [Solanum stenotomum]
MSSTSKAWVEAVKDQGVSRWNCTIKTINQHTKNNIKSYSQAKKISSQSSSMVSSNSKAKQSEESLRKVMYLSCWGPY